MNLEELKSAIETNELSDDFLVFKYTDNTFLVRQYLNEICNKKGYSLKPVKSVFETSNSALSLVFDSSTEISVVDVEEFAEVIEDFNELKNVIVICKKIEKKLEAGLKEFIVEFPKLVDWQIKDYMNFYCAGLEQDDYDWLYTASGGDIYKITNELDKLNLFEQKDRQKILAELKLETATDLFAQTILELSDAIATKNRQTLYEYLVHAKYLAYDPIALSNLLLKKYKNIAYVCLNSGLTAEQIGMQQKTYNGIKYYNKGYSAEAVYNAIKFLSEIDTRLKNNKLDSSADMLISYIINKMLA